MTRLVAVVVLKKGSKMVQKLVFFAFAPPSIPRQSTTVAPTMIFWSSSGRNMLKIWLSSIKALNPWKLKLVLFVDFRFHLSEVFEFRFYRNVENEVDISFDVIFSVVVINCDFSSTWDQIDFSCHVEFGLLDRKIKSPIFEAVFFCCWQYSTNIYWLQIWARQPVYKKQGQRQVFWLRIETGS